MSRDQTRGKGRIGLGDHRPDRAIDEVAGSFVGLRRDRDNCGFVEGEAGLFADFLEAAPGMHALEREAPGIAVEGKDAAACDEGGGATGSVGAGFRQARRADEVDLVDQGARRVFLAEQDHLGDQEIEIAGAERAGETDLALRVIADPNKVDVGLAVDLAAAQKKGIDPAEILSYCMSVDYAEMIDLQALLNTSMNIQIQKEADTDVKMLDFVQNNFTNRRVFQTMNHVGNETLLHMVNQILARLGLAKLPRTLLDRIDELVRPQSPIHPSVIRHFDLRYVDADTRYLVDRYRYLTYEEYLWNYIKFI